MSGDQPVERLGSQRFDLAPLRGASRAASGRAAEGGQHHLPDDDQRPHDRQDGEERLASAGAEQAQLVLARLHGAAMTPSDRHFGVSCAQP